MRDTACHRRLIMYSRTSGTLLFILFKVYLYSGKFSPLKNNKIVQY